tara:strand:+ start:165 stop:446 length:282 start_codon:yes stop_codon:yes gene_type:complete
MTIKPTFFNTRNERYHYKYDDTNSYLFTILFDSGAELNLILRDLKKNKKIVNYIYKKIYNTFTNVAEIDTGKLSLYEYNLLKQYKTLSVLRIC